MKKNKENLIKWLVVGLLVGFSIISNLVSVFSENLTANALTEEEINQFQTRFGTEVRIEVLKRSLIWHKERINTIITYLEEKQRDTSALEAIYEEFDKLIEDLSKIDVNDFNQSLETYLEVKKSMLMLTNQFRVEAQKLISTEDKAELGKRLSEVKKPSTEDLKQKIRKHNAELIQKRNKFCMPKPDALQEYINGNIDKKELIELCKNNSLKMMQGNPQKVEEIRKMIMNAKEERIQQKMQINKNALEKLAKTEQKINQRMEKLEIRKMELIRERERLMQRINQNLNSSKDTTKGNNSGSNQNQGSGRK
ncbi:MAG: hypothetical protein QXR30_00380 [Candidatus Woesearchaeota archaeon]